MNAAAIIIMNFIPVDKQVFAAVNDAYSAAVIFMNFVTRNGDVTGNRVQDSYAGHGVAVNIIVFDVERTGAGFTAILKSNTGIIVIDRIIHNIGIGGSTDVDTGCGLPKNVVIQN